MLVTVWAAQGSRIVRRRAPNGAGFSKGQQQLFLLGILGPRNTARGGHLWIRQLRGSGSERLHSNEWVQAPSRRGGRYARSGLCSPLRLALFM
jgi:hypothetical protein